MRTRCPVPPLVPKTRPFTPNRNSPAGEETPTVRALKDPLFLFLIAGTSLFAISVLVDKDPDPHNIHVDLDALTAFVQHRSQLQHPQLARARLEGMTPAERQFVIDSYVREEALYREALRLGFGDGDYVIRRRLAQNVEFMADGAASALPPLDEAALREYFESNREDYRQPPSLTLTHVFFDTSRRGEAQAREAAQQSLARLRAENIGFNAAAGQGDAFLYHRNYAESSGSDLAGHFGETMAGALFDIEPGAWQGPLRSPYGLHLVLIAARGEGGLPAFEEVRLRVRTDAEQARRREFTAERIDEIVGAYRVTADPLPSGRSPGGVARKKLADPSRQNSASSVNPDL